MMLPELDKYGPYVFTAYAIGVGVLVALVAWTIWRAGHARRRLDAVEKDETK
jgi:heme exporter protein CcmD